MKSYISYFKLRFITSLQYRASALAGIATQIFFGFVYIMVYLAFYESSNTNTPMTLKQLINYLWLNQIFLAIINLWHKDKDIFNLIKNGNISYELCRPQNLYFMWYIKIMAHKISSALLRSIPVFIIAFLLPEPYKITLPISFSTFIVFVVALIIATFLVSSIVTLYHVITIFTLDEKGVVGIMRSISDLFSGLVIPIPFFPKFLQAISNYLPFKYIGDFTFRIYTSHIPINEAIPAILIQLVWVIVIVILGYILCKIAVKRAVVQGG